MSENFNQKYDQLSKSHKASKKELQSIYQSHTIIDEIKENQLVDTVTNFFSVGGGKEALVLLGEKNKKPLCVKYFYPNSASNVKRTKQQYHVQTHEMASIMAKTEFHNLRILDYYGVNVPKPLEYNKGLAFSMEMIPFRNGDSEIKIPAPILKNINLYNIMDDPINFLEDSLDQIELMWKKALMCHGDLSEFNILVSDEKPFIIDVSQSRLYNVNTFSATPVRIRIDNALSIFVRDLKTIINHFEVKYKAYIEIDDVYEKMFNELPDFVREKNILETYDSIHNKSSKLIFMKDNEINTFTNMTLRGKDKKMLNLMRSLSSE